MELESRANKQPVRFMPIMCIIFMLNCAIGYIADKIPLTPLFVAIILGLLNCITLAYIYKKISKTFTRNRTGNLKNVGNIANYIYEKVTQLEAENRNIKTRKQ